MYIYIYTELNDISINNLMSALNETFFDFLYKPKTENEKSAKISYILTFVYLYIMLS